VPGFKTAIDVMREMDLGRIHAEADTPGQFLVIGQGEDGIAVATLTATGTRHGPDHPWIRRVGALDVTVPARPDRAAALLVVGGGEPQPAAMQAAARQAAAMLQQAGVPVVAVHLDGPARSSAVPLAGLPDVPAVRLPASASASQFEALVLPELFRQLPETRGADLALARQLPILRRTYARRLIEDTARANAWYALSTGVAETIGVLNLPLALADIVVLSKNQLVMAYKIALASGREDRPPQLLAQVVGVLGAGMLFRQVARELVGLLPAVGLVPKVAVAYTGTRLIGTVAESWALEGRRLGSGQLDVLMNDALAAGQRLAQDLVARRGSSGDSLPPPPLGSDS
jgi:uncharacterized protein (DUF697 family)